MLHTLYISHIVSRHHLICYHLYKEIKRLLSVVGQKKEKLYLPYNRLNSKTLFVSVYLIKIMYMFFVILLFRSFTFTNSCLVILRNEIMSVSLDSWKRLKDKI